MKVNLGDIVNPETGKQMDIIAVPNKSYYGLLGVTIASAILIYISVGRTIYKMGANDAIQAECDVLSKLGLFK